MLTQPIFEKLQQLRFLGMLKALEEQMQMPDIGELGFEERLGLLVDREITERENRRLKTRLRKARLRQNACVEDVDFRHPRKLDKTLFMHLADCRWLKGHNNVLLIGPTGVGKTYLACALAQKACRQGYQRCILPAAPAACTILPSQRPMADMINFLPASVESICWFSMIGDWINLSKNNDMIFWRSWKIVMDCAQHWLQASCL